MDEQDLAWIAERGKARAASMLAIREFAQQRMRRLLLIADALEQSSAEDVRAEAAREIRQLCEWIAHD